MSQELCWRQLECLATNVGDIGLCCSNRAWWIESRDLLAVPSAAARTNPVPEKAGKAAF